MVLPLLGITGATLLGSALGSTVKPAVEAVTAGGSPETLATENKTSTPTPYAPTAPQTNKAVENLGGTQTEALKAIGEIGEIEAPILTEQGQQLRESGQVQQIEGQDRISRATTNEQVTQEQLNKSVLEAESMLKKLSENTVIDPNRYIGQMGLGQKTLAGIGLVLSGIGSGLAGQNNLANEALQRNIDRDIETQKETINNNIKAIAEQRGIILSTKDKLMAEQASALAGGVLVNSGVENATKGVGMQVSGETAKQRAAVVQNAAQQKYVEGLNGFNSMFVQMSQSGDAHTKTLLGMIIDGIKGTTAPTHGLGTSVSSNMVKPEDVVSSVADGSFLQWKQSAEQDKQTQTAMEPIKPATPSQKSFLDKMSERGTSGK